MQYIALTKVLLYTPYTFPSEMGHDTTVATNVYLVDYVMLTLIYTYNEHLCRHTRLSRAANGHHQLPGNKIQGWQVACNRCIRGFVEDIYYCISQPYTEVREHANMLLSKI